MLRRASKKTGDKADVSKRRVTTPILLQMHASECGAACLGSVLAYFGRWVPLTELREKCEVSRDGSSAASILRASRHYGLECNGLSVRAGQLKKLDLPLILFWQFSHFVVLRGVRRPPSPSQRPVHGAAQAHAGRIREGLQRHRAAVQARRRFQPRRQAAQPVQAAERLRSSTRGACSPASSPADSC